ncbi:MAG: alcohol dehydrogenase [Herpetosiphonaceae bacterium]|nr:MAG: alcohol dehydrogenase [Herpetosiphonaceae bacterium]
MQEFFEFQLRPRVLFKPGLSREIAHDVALLGCSKAVIIADPGVVAAKLLEPVQQGLSGAVDIVGIYSDVPANSSVQVVEAAAAFAREHGADLIVAVGGGSPLDTAKCVRILLTEGGRLHDYEGYNLLERPLVPMIAIPTTAGTGSEVTPYAVIRDEEQQIKLTFSSPYLAPDLAILDPLLTLTLPPRLTAATGLDALTHAIETYVSTEANPISEALALGAMDTISNSLRQATFQGDDLEARSQMLIASCMAGMAFSSSFLGVVHALAHALGGHFPVHHGTANAIFLPHGMRYNSVVAPERFARIARQLGVNVGGRSRPEVIEDGIAAVETLVKDLGLPTRLRDVDVPYEALDELAEIALGDGAIYHNPRPATLEDLREILEAAW